MNEPVEEEPLAFEEAVSAVTEAVEPASQSSSLYSGDSSSMEKGAQHLQFKGRFILTSVKSRSDVDRSAPCACPCAV